MYSTFDFDKTLVQCVPSARQLAVEQMEFYAFAHFTVNTFTDKEWGDGTESESIFNATELNADQWVDALKTAHIKGLILTCKHHDGFCLWPSAYTEHSVKNSPYRDGKGDVVREVADAFRRGGIAVRCATPPQSAFSAQSSRSARACNPHTARRIPRQAAPPRSR